MTGKKYVKIDDSAYVQRNQTGIKRDKIDVEQLMFRYEIEEKDLTAIKETLKPLITPLLSEMIEDFYKWMKKLPEYGEFFGSNAELLARVKHSQKKYWEELLDADIDDVFVEKRLQLADVHSRIDLPLDSYFAALAYFNNWVFKVAIDQENIEKVTSSFASFLKLQQVDMFIVTEEYSAKKNELIQRQAQTITKLATPIAVLANEILLVSIIGVIDSKRAQEVLETTLAKVLETNSKVTIIDIAGVDMVDTAVANHLIKMTQAIKLMGCSCILSGMSPGIALTVVQLGIDLSVLTTKPVLRDAVEAAYEIVKDA
ncbi:MAG: rsbT co-antagonist protein RsbR [Saprospiraceae bacterium]|jgi:rsbT co-antagonist protein RsbR